MVLALVGILLILWLVGILIHIATAFIQVLLVIALILFIYDRMVAPRTPKK
jgi:hypothetical protein